MPTSVPGPVGVCTREGRAVVASFDGGAITSDVGALLLGATDLAIGLVRRFAACFADDRAPGWVEHSVATLVGQRVLALALGYEDLVDHYTLRHDPVLAAVAGSSAPVAPIARHLPASRPSTGSSTRRRGRPRATTRSAMTARRSSGCSSSCSSTRTGRRPRRSCSTWMRLTTRCTARRRARSSTATIAATASCRSMSSAVTICWSPSCGGRASTPAPGRSRKSQGSWRRSAPAGLMSGSSCAPTAASPVTG